MRERGAPLCGMSALRTKTPQGPWISLKDHRCHRRALSSLGQTPLLLAGCRLSCLVHVQHSNILLPEFQREAEASPPPLTLSLGLSMLCPACSPAGLDGDSESEDSGRLSASPARGNIFTLLLALTPTASAYSFPSCLKIYIFFIVSTQ